MDQVGINITLNRPLDLSTEFHPNFYQSAPYISFLIKLRLALLLKSQLTSQRLEGIDIPRKFYLVSQAVSIFYQLRIVIVNAMFPPMVVNSRGNGLNYVLLNGNFLQYFLCLFCAFYSMFFPIVTVFDTANIMEPGNQTGYIFI